MQNSAAKERQRAAAFPFVPSTMRLPHRLLLIQQTLRKCTPSAAISVLARAEDLTIVTWANCCRQRRPRARPHPLLCERRMPFSTFSSAGLSLRPEPSHFWRAPKSFFARTRCVLRFQEARLNIHRLDASACPLRPPPPPTGRWRSSRRDGGVSPPSTPASLIGPPRPALPASRRRRPCKFICKRASAAFAQRGGDRFEAPRGARGAAAIYDSGVPPHPPALRRARTALRAPPPPPHRLRAPDARARHRTRAALSRAQNARARPVAPGGRQPPLRSAGEGPRKDAAAAAAVSSGRGCGVSIPDPESGFRIAEGRPPGRSAPCAELRPPIRAERAASSRVARVAASPANPGLQSSGRRSGRSAPPRC